MTRKLFVALLLAAPCVASGPKYVGSSTPADIKMEFDNVYQDIANPNINFATISTAIISSAQISTFTASSATITNLTVGTITGVSSGKFKQLFSTSTVGSTSTNSGTYVSTQLQGTFTLTSATSTVDILMSCEWQTSSNNAGTSSITLFRNGTDLDTTAGAVGFTALQLNIGAAGTGRIPVGIIAHDAPGVTAVQYVVKIKNNNSQTVAFNDLTGPCHMVFYEIGT